MSEVKFANGLIVKKNDKAPDFVLCNLSFKVEEFIQFLKENQKDGWVNVSINKSQKGSYYGKVETWQKPAQVPPNESVRPIIGGIPEIDNGVRDDLPF